MYIYIYVTGRSLLYSTLTIQHTQKLKAHRSTEGNVVYSRDLYLFLQLCLPLNIDTGSQVPGRPGHTHTHTHTQTHRHRLTVIAYSTKVLTESLYLFHCICAICKDLSAKFCGRDILIVDTAIRENIFQQNVWYWHVMLLECYTVQVEARKKHNNNNNNLVRE